MSLLDHFRARHIVLLYHRIARVNPDPWCLCVTPEHFAEHLEVLSIHRCVRLDQIGRSGWRVGKSRLSVAITFDDGYADNLHEAARLLMRFNMPATFFIATGYIGGTRELWWDELERIVFQPALDNGVLDCSTAAVNLLYDPRAPRSSTYLQLYEKLQPLNHDLRRSILDELLEWTGLASEARESHRCLTIEEILRLGSESLFELGGHTATHALLAAQPLDCQFAEIGASKTWLENLLGQPIASFSYPYGGCSHYTRETVRVVAETGFARACSTSGQPVSQLDGPYELPRFNVTDMDGGQFEKFLFS